MDFLKEQEKAKVLIEALPYIRKFHGKIVVIKYGGKAMVDEEIKASVIKDIALLSLVGLKIVLVHGGGPQINEYLEKLNIKPVFKDGLRVTDEKTMEIVRMVLIGKINKELVVLLKNQGVIAIGLSGEDAGLLEGQVISGELGQVGTIVKVKTEIIHSLLSNGFLPVIATVAVSADGKSLNVNADEAASKIAVALGAEKIIFLTDVDGIVKEGSLVSKLSVSEGEMLISENVVSGGMKPKLKASLEAVKGGVKQAHILNGTLSHALLLEIFTDAGVGTMIEGEN